MRAFDNCNTTGNREKLYEDILKQTMEGAVLAKLHPRTIISVTVQVQFPCKRAKNSGKGSVPIMTVLSLTRPLRSVLRSSLKCRSSQTMVQPWLQL